MRRELQVAKEPACTSVSRKEPQVGHDDRLPVPGSRRVEVHIEYWPECPERQSRDKIIPVEIQLVRFDGGPVGELLGGSGNGRRKFATPHLGRDVVARRHQPRNPYWLPEEALSSKEIRHLIGCPRPARNPASGRDPRRCARRAPGFPPEVDDRRAVAGKQASESARCEVGRGGPGRNASSERRRGREAIEFPAILSDVGEQVASGLRGVGSRSHKHGLQHRWARHRCLPWQRAPGDESLPGVTPLDPRRKPPGLRA